MRAIYTAFCFLLLLNVCVVQAEPRVISLNLLEQDLSPLKVYQNVPIKVTNTFKANLYNFTVSKPPLPKEILSVTEFHPGQSFELHFPKVGTYEICFSKGKNAARTCLKLDVLKRTIA